MALERSPEWEQLSQNHLEGRSAAFFCYGDGGGDELDESGRPKILKKREYFDPEREPFDDMRDVVAPIVWQCRYSGIEVPDALWSFAEFGRGRPYSEAQAEHMMQDAQFIAAFDAWGDALARHVSGKGKVQPGQYRAFGYQPPSHVWADVKTKWRGLRMILGIPKNGTSPAVQQKLGLNRDTGIHYKDSESARQ
jgi:hypothetical protein